MLSSAYMKETPCEQDAKADPKSEPGLLDRSQEHEESSPNRDCPAASSKRKRAPAQRFKPSQFSNSKDLPASRDRSTSRIPKKREQLPPATITPEDIRVRGLCFSCCLVELETLPCTACGRRYCFGCMCICVSVMQGAWKLWRCPSCIGQEEYDYQLGQRIKVFRERIKNMPYTQGELDEFSQLVFDLFSCCAWKEWEANVSVLITILKTQLSQTQHGVEIGLPAIAPYHAIHYSNVLDGNQMRSIAEIYAQHAAIKASLSIKHNDRQGDGAAGLSAGRLSMTTAAGHEAKGMRIGYVSSQFINHPTLDLMWSTLEWHRRLGTFDVFLYSTAPSDGSALRTRLEQTWHPSRFRLLPPHWSDKECADVIRADGLSVLVSVDGYTEGERTGMLALKPAGMIVTYLGYPGTSGAAYVDYALVDTHVVPVDHAQYFSESLLTLPHCYQCNSFTHLYPQVVSAPPLSRADYGLPAAPAVVLCCFNRLGRVTEELFTAWMRILAAVPHAVLWLYKHPAAATPRLLHAAAAAGIACERVLFAGYCDKEEHLRRLALADLCLDTVVHNGHTTGSDVLWAGVPMITLAGGSMPARVGASLLSSVGMPHLIARDLPHYHALAVSLASDPVALRRYSLSLAYSRGDPVLCNNKMYY